ncbi:MAG: hypothetical protein LBL91_03775 [Lachnospiraceae bacterium]|jgi:hypothetical protein|nr:hypothetical protein [Lachnospiraceae bacterium]
MAKNRINDTKETNRDTMHRKYIITINEPFEKGYTHEVIKELLENKFKSILYYCFSEEKRYKTSCSYICSIQNTGSLFSSQESL